MNTILAVRHAKDKGKTDTVRAFAKALLDAYPGYKPVFPLNAAIPPSGDFRLVVEINGKIIGIESCGDPGSDLELRLGRLVTVYNCCIIVCTCRTSGETVYAVENVARTHQFQTVWTSTYQTANPLQHSSMNQIRGRHILEVITDMGLIIDKLDFQAAQLMRGV